MRTRKYDFFSIWLGLTILAVVVLVFLTLTKWQPDFFRNMTFVL